MNKMRVSEYWNGIQGEGRYAGVPSFFLRSFGCSLRCPGFGRDHAEADTPNPDVRKIIDLIPVYEAEGRTFLDLPLSPTGCDTYAAVYPEFKGFSVSMTVTEIVDKMQAALPRGKFHKEQHLIFTGGEPLLPGWQKVYPGIVDEIHHRGMVDGDLFITFETNGTQKINPASFGKLALDAKLHFSVSPKLSASGEAREDAIKANVVLDYMRYGLVDLKFVARDEEDAKEVNELLRDEFNFVWKSPLFGSVYLMPEGGMNEQYASNAPAVADLAIKHGFRFSPRLQNSLYGNSWNT